jgi:bifunctional NMN adenylyltransferase/nudix hydrolase
MSTGVIVGRFQVPDLHAGHLALLDHVKQKHQQVIVFIGVSRTDPTNRNPLNFNTRKLMIQSRYPDFLILPIGDDKSDRIWSAHLDMLISSAITGNVFLYGGKDSFLLKYSGVYEINFVSFPKKDSGTKQRANVVNQTKNTSDFRAGAIYAVGNQHPRALITVDVAVVQNQGYGNFNVLLGKKPGEQNYRFVGGFVEPGESLEAAARREVHEETGVILEEVEYVTSLPVADWRYLNDADAKITTALFIGWTISAYRQAGDDIECAEWFDFERMPVLESEHEVLADAFKNRMRRYNANISS